MRRIWLSHVLDSSTPLYGGAKDIRILQEKSILNGDSCNTSMLSFSSHSGTHVDAPLHFVDKGKGVDQYAPDEWYFESIRLLFLKVSPGQIIDMKDLALPGSDEDGTTDMLLLCTDFGANRDREIYWRSGPGLSPELAVMLKKVFPRLRALGMNFISVSSLHDREKGRAAHRAFLNLGIRLFEDMNLCDLNPDIRLKNVTALPLRFKAADGAPCSIIGEIE